MIKMALNRVKTDYGWIKGIDYGSFSVFKGIPYAKPPVGRLRFKPPQRPENWDQDYSAEKFPGICWQDDPQNDTFYYKEFYEKTWNQEKRTEDCLYLNIWTPAKDAGEKLPVMFWIHGGAFTHGYGHEEEFDGEAYCKRGVILVTIQYRLGIFGFFAHPWFAEENFGNLGLLDQIAALEWVYENIDRFGGDRDNITAAGQSAGGVSVQALMTSPLSEGKIKRAIMQSGGGYGQLSRRSISQKEAADHSSRWLERHGITEKETLRNMDAEYLFRLSKDFVCRFVLDGYVLDKSGEDYLYGRPCCDACILGSTLNDIRITEEMNKNGQYGDLYLGNIKFAEMMSGKARVYLYYFTRQLPGDNAGAFHSSELWYMFGTQYRSWRCFKPEDMVLSETMLDDWSSFMKNGIPDTAQEKWLDYCSESKYIKVF